MPGRRIVAALAVALTAVLGGAAIGDPSPASAACSISTSVRIGSTGDAVRCVQSTLNELGYDSGPVDGNFGPVTYGAVVRYQRAEGLAVDGWVGPQTGGSLAIWGTSTSPPTPAPAPAPAPAPPAPSGCTIASTLRVGSTGSQVSCLQTALDTAGFSPGPIDGIFGSMTRGAVVRYQQAKALFVDGVVGPQTGGSLGIWGTASSGGSGGSGSSGSGCTPPAGVPAGARQVVMVTSSGTTAGVDLLVFEGGAWTCSRSDMYGRVGPNGVRPLTERRSGDGTTPAGIFPLGSMTAPDGQTFQFFGNGANPGVQGTWRQVRAGDCWGATPGTAHYNQLVTRTAAECQAPDEYLVNFQQSYSRAAVIGANLGPNRSGDDPGEPAYAAAIFLHRHSYDAAGNTRPTSGCVSLSNDNMIFVLQRLVPGEAYFVIR